MRTVDPLSHYPYHVCIINPILLKSLEFFIMPTKIVFTKHAANFSKILLRFFSISLVAFFLTGCLLQPVQE